MRALILAPFSERVLAQLRRDIDVTYESWLDTRRLWDPEALGQRLARDGFDALVVEADFVFEETFEAAPNLRFVGVCRNALNQVDLDAATRHGVLVVHAPSRNAIAVAELTLGLMFALLRNVPAADAFIRNGEWRDPAEAYRRWRGRELAGSVVGVVGLGHIGTEVARRCGALGARVIASDPYVTPSRAHAVGARLVPLPSLLRRADIVTVHAAASDRPIIDRAALARMRSNAVLINTGAAAAVDYAALTEALEAGRIAGAGLDVFPGHPLPPGSPLAKLPNVVLTPHIGGATRETVERHSRMIAADLLRALRGQRPKHLANPEALRVRA
ncbi:MAG TPA: NAD(P)-dependent oxidoreductase [Candidatus Tectomicrobia bacterium]|nr:NAD(P)-dependent oxidoreductase [Candidatus Tectomicrobia bacterium]